MTCSMKNATENTKEIHASPERIYHACTHPEELIRWRVPGNMTAKIHHYDLREGGGYKMSLLYPPKQGHLPGKTDKNEDRYSANFKKLDPPNTIIEAIQFSSADPQFSGEMIMEISLIALKNSTKVSIKFTHIPKGINPKDNETGTNEALEKLARLVE